MIVKELIEMLKKLPPDSTVIPDLWVNLSKAKPGPKLCDVCGAIEIDGACTGELPKYKPTLLYAETGGYRHAYPLPSDDSNYDYWYFGC